MVPKFKELFSLKSIDMRLQNLVAWAPIAAPQVLDKMLCEVKDEWTLHQDMWLQRCEHAIKSIGAIARGIEDGDYSMLGQALQPMRHTENELAWMLCTLDDRGFTPQGLAPVLPDARRVLQLGVVAPVQQQLQLPQLPAAAGRRQAIPQVDDLALLCRCKICGTTMQGCPTFASVALGPAAYTNLSNHGVEGLVAAVRAHFRLPSVVCRNCQKYTRNDVRAGVAAGHEITFDFFNGIIDDTYVIRLPHVRKTTNATPPVPEHVAPLLPAVEVVAPSPPGGRNKRQHPGGDAGARPRPAPPQR